MTLEEFLAARLDELRDEAPSLHYDHCGSVGAISFPCDCGYPARVLREVEAGRKILAAYMEAEPGSIVWDVLGFVLTVRAAVWCDHPDYDEAWRP